MRLRVRLLVSNRQITGGRAATNLASPERVGKEEEPPVGHIIDSHRRVPFGDQRWVESWPLEPIGDARWDWVRDVG